MKKRVFLKISLFSTLFFLNSGLLSLFSKNNYYRFKKVQNKGSVWILSEND